MIFLLISVLNIVNAEEECINADGYCEYSPDCENDELTTGSAYEECRDYEPNYVCCCNEGYEANADGNSCEYAPPDPCIGELDNTECPGGNCRDEKCLPPCDTLDNTIPCHNRGWVPPNNTIKVDGYCRYSYCFKCEPKSTYSGNLNVGCLKYKTCGTDWGDGCVDNTKKQNAIFNDEEANRGCQMSNINSVCVKCDDDYKFIDYYKGCELVIIPMIDKQGGNPTYNKEAYDVFGLYYRRGTTKEHNAPTVLQSKFAQKGTDEADAWVLSKVEWPTGSTTEWVYEVDDWHSARGDLEYPYQDRGYYNYYAYLRGYYKEQYEKEKEKGKSPLPYELPGYGTDYGVPSSDKCKNNYGGGIRVKTEKTCDLVNNPTTTKRCATTTYTYEKYNPELKCTISTGSATIVPTVTIGSEEYYPNSGSSRTINDNDLRKPGHTGGKQGSGGIMYNYVKVTTDTTTGYVEYYYLTSDSMHTDKIDTTDGSLPFGNRSEDGFSGLGTQAGAEYSSQSRSAGTTDKSWMRGQEYKIVYYDKDGNKLKELQRYYEPNEHFKWYFGGDRVGKAPYNWTYDEKNLYGFSSGWTNLYKTRITHYDPDNNNKFSYITQNEFDENIGLPKKIEECISLDGITCIGDKKITKIDYAYNHYQTMEDKHMVLQPFKVSILDKNNNVISETVTTYKEET